MSADNKAQDIQEGLLQKEEKSNVLTEKQVNYAI